MLVRNTDALMQILDRMRTSLWFVPGLLTLGAVLLAVLTTSADRLVPDEWLVSVPLVFSGGPAGARAVLSTIATSMIGIAGVVFSMTIVSLQLASSQFGPRLLRSFLRDRGNQYVLGTFVAIFLYCTLVLPSIDTTAEAEFVPHIAVTVAVLGAIVGLAMLVYFIDHVAQSIHADAVIDSVGKELEESLERVFPEGIGEGRDAAAEENPDRTWKQVLATRSGYVRVVSGEVLLRLAKTHEFVIRIDAVPGTFVIESEPLASVDVSGAIPDEVGRKIVQAFIIGPHRTTLQDSGFAFEQLTEMALRALSSGINDPTTAIHCIHRLGAGLAKFVVLPVPSSTRTDEDGTVRALAEPVALSHILDVSLEPIARCAASQLPVWLSLLSIQQVAHERARRDQDQILIRDQALRFVADARERFEGARDREHIRDASLWAVS